MKILAQFERTVGNLSSAAAAGREAASSRRSCFIALSCAARSRYAQRYPPGMPGDVIVCLTPSPPGSGVGGFVVEALAGPRAAIFRLEPSGGRAQGIITIGRRRQLKRPRLDAAWLRHASFSRHALGRADHLRTGSNMLGNLFGSVHHCPVASLYNHSSCNSNALCNKPRGYRPNKRSE
jgi:hypothetical protein